MLRERLIGSQWPWTVRGVAVGDPDRWVTPNGMRRIQFADPRSHALDPFDIGRLESIFAVGVTFEFVGDRIHEQVRPPFEAVDQRTDPKILIRLAGPQP